MDGAREPRDAPERGESPAGPGRTDSASPKPERPFQHVSADDPTLVSPDSPRDGGAATFEPPEDLEGQRIGGYHLREELHRGGQGVVYRAIQLGTKREVALKVLLEGPFASEASRRRFEREVELAASLRHPGIVTILDSGVSLGRYYFAMEYIEGLRLDRYLARHRLPMRDTLRLLADVCDAVNYAHQRGVIHRDLKPSNILVDRDGQCHVLDFGLAKAAQEVEGEKSTVQVLSVAGQLLGTVAYMSPEQTRGSADVDVRSDVYSLGVVFYEALVGQLPYSVDGPLADVLTRIATQEPRSPRTARSSSRFGRRVDDEMQTILLKCLEKDPARRYQTAGDLSRDLRHLLAGEPIEAKRASTFYVIAKTLRRYRLQASAAAALLMMLVVFLVMFAVMWTGERAARERADLHQQQAVQRAIELAEAQRALRDALFRQTIKRGEAAQASGDLVAARDFYWDAYEQPGGPAALWALRQYYASSAEVGAAVAFFERGGPVQISPGGALVAVCGLPDSITVRNSATGRVVGWYRAPGPVLQLSIDDAGNVAAAGAGWVRLWQQGTARPAISAELAEGIEVRGLHCTPDAKRLFVVGPQRVWRFDQGAPAVAEVRLSGEALGGSALASERGQLAVTTNSGVNLITLEEDGPMRLWRLGPQNSRPHVVSFVGEELVAAAEEAVFKAAARPDDNVPWDYVDYLWISEPWQLFDYARDTGLGAFGLSDGSVLVGREGREPIRWSISSDGLAALRVTPDGNTIITVDDTGTVTRWRPGRDAVGVREVFDQPVRAWAVAEDGSAALLADERHRVIALRPQASPESEIIQARRPFQLPMTGGEVMSLALSRDAQRTVVCAGNTIRLRERKDTGEQLSYSCFWSAPAGTTPENEGNAGLAGVSGLLELEDVALSGDGAILAIRARTLYGDRQQVSLWRWAPRLQTRRSIELQTLMPPAGPPLEFSGSSVRAMAFVPGRQRLLVARSNGQLIMLTPEQQRTHAADAAVTVPRAWRHLRSAPVAVAFDRRGERLAVSCEDGFIRILATIDGHEEARLSAGRLVRAMSFSPDGEVLAARTADGMISLFEVAASERITHLAGSRGSAGPVIAWIGPDDSILLGTEGGVAVYPYDALDITIAANRTYGHQRRVARLLAQGEFAEAWFACRSRPGLGANTSAELRTTVLQAALRRMEDSVPGSWIQQATANAAPTALLRLGHAAYDGGRFIVAGRWLREAREQLDGRVDAYTDLRVAQCDYVLGRYAEAIEGFAALLGRPDLDADSLATAQLQQVAALVLADRLEEARVVARRMGKLRPDAPRADVVGTHKARQIVYYLTGQETESPTIAVVDRFVVEQIAGGLDPEGVLRYQDDPHFFRGELERKRGNLEEAAVHYQRCIDVARDAWPSNWARYRVGQLSPATQ